MANNALGELFTETAEAIREKTGDTAKMKPADFPAAIRSIVVSSGTGDGSGDGTIVYKLGVIGKVGSITFDELTYGTTIEHGLGVTPDYIALYGYRVDEDFAITTITGMSSYWQGIFDAEYCGQLIRNYGSISVAKPYDADTSSAEIMGLIRDVNETSFTVGCETTPLAPLKYFYTVIASVEA